MRDWKHWEATLSQPSFYPETREKVLRLNSHYEDLPGYKPFRQALTDAEANFEELFRLLTDYFTQDKLREVLELERAAFSDALTYAGKFLGVSEDFYSAISIARTRYFIAILIAMDPHQLRRQKERKRTAPRTIAFGGCRSLLKVFRGELRARVWEIEPYDDSTDLAAGTLRAEPREDVLMRPGQELRLSPFEEFEYLEHSTGALFINAQVTQGEAPVAVHCDVESGAIRSTSSVGQEASRLQMLSTFLRIMNRKDAYEAIEGLLEDSRHFVRWHAMRELIGLDAERSLPHLIEMSRSDRQLAVRRAAAKTLDQFFPGALSAGGLPEGEVTCLS